MAASEFFRSCAAAVNNASCVRTVSSRRALSAARRRSAAPCVRLLSNAVVLSSDFNARVYPLQPVGTRGQEQNRGEKQTDEEQREQDHSAARQELGRFHQSQRLQRKNTSM